MDKSGTHGLSYSHSQGRHPQHSSINHLIKDALGVVDTPSILEQHGLNIADDLRPDGLTLIHLGVVDTPSILEQHGLNTADDLRPDRLTLIHWSRGCSLVWDATIHVTFAISNLDWLAV